jgi:1-acyl-sn-glycerol-3-phosphate acyltransferase
MSGGPAGTPTAVLRPLSEANREPGREVIFNVVSLLHAVLRPLTKRDWRHQEKVPQTGGVVFIVNHISNVDPLAIGQYLAFSGRWPRFLAKASLFQVPVLRAVLRGCAQIPVQRGSAAAKDALSAAVAAVRDGRAVVVYLEGTITLDPDLWPMRGRTGAARIALQTNAPVVPLGQWGAQDIMYGKKIHFPKLLPRKTLRVVTGDPVPLDDLRDVPMTAAVLAEATDRMLRAVTGLVAELRQEPPPPEPYDSGSGRS